MRVKACGQCGAPLEQTDTKPIVCHFCKAEQVEEPEPKPAPVVIVRRAPAPREVPRVEEDVREPSTTWGAKVAVGIGIAAMAIGLVASLVRRSSPAPVAPTVSSPVAVRPSASASVAPVLPPGPEVTLTLSAVGQGEGAFQNAEHIAVDAQGALYVVDETGRVQKFAANGTFVSTFRAETTNKPHGALSTDIGIAQGLAVDRKGVVWTSIGYDLVGYEGTTGKQAVKIPHQFPATCFRDLAFDQTGSLFALSACTDSDRYAIMKLDGAGHVLATWPESPAWQTDATSKLAIDAAGNVYAPHQYQNRVVVMDPHGKEKSFFGGRGDALGFFDVSGPAALAIDGGGRLFAANGEFVDVYDLLGHAQKRLGGRWDGRVKDLAVGPDGQLWVMTASSVVRLKVAG